MEIKVTVRNVYGKPVVYPYCEKAKIFAEIAGTKTLSTGIIRAIKRLGYTVTLDADASARAVFQ